MLTVALVAQKGGVGKTTLALHLAVEAERAGERVAVVDLDPQGSALAWFRRRKLETPEVGPAKETNLTAVLADCAKRGYSLVIVDTPPGVRSPTALAAGKADLVLIPCTPAPQDLDALAPTVLLVERAKRPAFLILNRGRGESMNGDVRALLKDSFSIPACPVTIYHRTAYADAFLQGGSIAETTPVTPSVLKGRAEIRSLWEWVKRAKHHGKK